jgi:hypothetical protein
MGMTQFQLDYMSGQEALSHMDNIYEIAEGDEYAFLFGGFYQDHNRLKDRKMYGRALSGFEKVRGPEQSSILPTVNNLGCATVL